MENKEIVKKDGEVVVTPSAIIREAIGAGANLEQVEKLLILRERDDAFKAKKAYNEAMAAFKADPPKIDKDKTVNYNQVKYSHASLYNVTEKINTALSKHGLSASWATRQNGEVCVTCKITHKQGHSEETTLQAPADKSGSKNSIQAIGSTITYLQRYTLLALTGLATHADDDGQASEPAAVVDETQYNQLIDMIAQTGSDEAKFCEFFKIENVTGLPMSKFKQAILMLSSKNKGKKK